MGMGGDLIKTLIWAHRGASAYAPENTMEAFALAHKMGADGLELDIHLTSDGHVVVAHDETLERCSNGRGKIHDYTLEELKKLDFSGGKPGFSGIKIPTLEEVLDFARSASLAVNIEIKSEHVLYEGIEAKAKNLVAAAGMKERVIYSSFNHYSLMILRSCEPAAPIGLLYMEAMVDPYVYALHLNANAIHPYYPTLRVPQVIGGCKGRGLRINAWTVDHPEHIGWLLKEEIDGIITNKPDIAVALRKETQKA